MHGPPPEMLVIFAEEFRRQIRNMGFVLFTVTILAMMLIAIPLTPVVVHLLQDANTSDTANPGDNSLERIGYVDLAGVLRGDQEAPRRFSDRAAAIQAFRQGEIESVFVIPVDYVESGVVEYYRTTSGKGIGELWDTPAERDFQGFLRANLIAGRLDPDLMTRALFPANYRSFDVADDGSVAEAAPLAQAVGEITVPILFGVLLMIAVLTGAGSVMRSVAEEKETRMIEMLVTSAAPGAILGGKLLAVVSAGLIHIAAWIIVGAFALPEIFDRIPNGGELTISAGLLATVSVSFVLGYFLFSVLAMLIGSIVSSAAEGQRQTGFLGLLMGLPVWLSSLIINQPDGRIAEVLTYFPFSAPTMLMLRLGAGSDMSWGEIAAVLALVAATGLAMLWITARIFRAGILLSGQRITGRNLIEALTHAG